MDEIIISKAIIENDLIEEFHWLPQDIAKIPYKSLQTFYTIRREKVYARQAKAERDAKKKEQTKSVGRTRGRG